MGRRHTVAVAVADVVLQRMCAELYVDSATYHPLSNRKAISANQLPTRLPYNLSKTAFGTDID